MAERDWTFRVAAQPKLITTWYRWVTPDGEVWAESTNPGFVKPDQARRLRLRLHAQTVYEVTTAWREIVDVQLPDAGVLPPAAGSIRMAGD